jgi:hypothetical protein
LIRRFAGEVESLLSYESDAEAFMEAPASCRRAIDEVAALGAPRRDADT